MKMQIMGREFSSAVAAVASVIDQSSKVPIMRAVRISIADNAARFLGSNTEQTVTATRAVAGNGTACIDVGALAAKTGLLNPDMPVDISGDEKTVTVSQGKTRWNVPIMLDDYPISLGEPLSGEYAELSVEAIQALVIVKGAALPDNSAKYGGVWLDQGHVVAVDGRQMRMIDIGTDIGSATLPLKAIDVLASLFKEAVTVRMNERAIEFRTENLILKSRLLEGKPADWKSGLDRFRSQSVNSCLVLREDFLACLRRAAAIRTSGDKQGSFINMMLRFRENAIEVYTRNQAGEEGLDAVECDGGIETDVGMNGGMFIDAVNSVQEDMLRISYGDKSCGVFVEPSISERTDIRIVFPRLFT